MRIGNPRLVWSPRENCGGEAAPVSPNHGYTTATERNRGLFVNMRNQNLKKGRKVLHGGLVRSRVVGLCASESPHGMDGIRRTRERDHIHKP